jgi:hypothetical protein
MFITAKCITPLMFATEIDLPVGNALNVEQVTHGDIVGRKVLSA